MAININVHFGREVQKHRKNQGLSQLSLAEKSGMNLSTVNRIERGIANVTLKNAFRLSKSLHVPLYKFFLVDKGSRNLDRKNQIEGLPVD